MLGGTGRTGLNFTKMALDAGHSVTAVVRREPAVAGTLATSGAVIGTGSSAELGGAEAKEGASQAHLVVVGPHDNLKVVVVPDQTKPENLKDHMAGHDCVIVTLGAFPTAGQPFSLYSSAAAGYIPAMQANGITRL